VGTGGVDDWLILPPVWLEAGLQYRLSFAAKKSGIMNNATLAVHYGLSADPALLINAIGNVDPISTTHVEYQMDINPLVSQAVFIGIRALGSSRGGSVFLDDIGIERISVPFLAPSDLNAVAGEGEISLNWQAPAARDLDSYKIYRDGYLYGSAPAGQTPLSMITLPAQGGIDIL
jgi:hypothetical protein